MFVYHDSYPRIVGQVGVYQSVVLGCSWEVYIGFVYAIMRFMIILGPVHLHLYYMDMSLASGNLHVYIMVTPCRPDDDSERGRPRITVNIEEVEFLRSLNFQWKKIANILGVSRSTLYRRLHEEGMQEDLWFSDISDDDLDILIKQIKEEHRNDGEVLMAGHLAARNIRVQRTRLRASIHRVDPINTENDSGG